MYITEIFKSIQGEGTRAGRPCIFVRLTGCNLRCTWCDTAYAFHGGQEMSIENVLERVEALNHRPDGAPACAHAVLFSPVHKDAKAKWKGLEPRELVEWILEDGLSARLGLQMHKIVWDPLMRGV
jgi:organic radical activating enzyme